MEMQFAQANLMLRLLGHMLVVHAPNIHYLVTYSLMLPLSTKQTRQGNNRNKKTEEARELQRSCKTERERGRERECKRRRSRGKLNDVLKRKTTFCCCCCCSPCIGIVWRFSKNIFTVIAAAARVVGRQDFFFFIFFGFGFSLHFTSACSLVFAWRQLHMLG